MSPHPTALLGLGPLPRPSISAEPGPEIPLGRPVTLQCRGPVGVYAFRLEREDRSEYKDNYNVFRLGPFESEARFRIDSVREANAGLYRCIYYKTPRWSEHSDYLDLVVKGPPRSKDEKQKLQQRPDLAVDVLERTAGKGGGGGTGLGWGSGNFLPIQMQCGGRG
uniref:Immunoglobulin domain-containing protein n=1 Tax=Piliocolobus tephrosceles TaxID=591936 RepID=A0A8C9IWW9_9PRIM